MPPGRSCSTTFPTGPRSTSTTETLLRLAEHHNIVGLKDCGADRAQSIELLRQRPAGFRVLTGEDAQYYEALTDGADGAILLSAHIETDSFAAVRTHCAGRQPRRRARVLARLSELTRLLFAEPSPAPAKYWLARTGLIDSAEVRLPMVEVSAELAARLDAEIEDGGSVKPRGIAEDCIAWSLPLVHARRGEGISKTRSSRERAWLTRR